jgi:hypothetical protein
LQSTSAFRPGDPGTRKAFFLSLLSHSPDDNARCLVLLGFHGDQKILDLHHDVEDGFQFGPSLCELAWKPPFINLNQGEHP